MVLVGAGNVFAFEKFEKKINFEFRDLNCF